MSQYIIYVVLHFWNYYPRVELTAAAVVAAFIGCVCFCTFDYGQMRMRSFPAWQFYGDVESDGVVTTAKLKRSREIKRAINNMVGFGLV